MGHAEETEMMGLTYEGAKANPEAGDPSRRITGQIEACFLALDKQQEMLRMLTQHMSAVLRPDDEDSSEKPGALNALRQSPMMGNLRDMEARIHYNTAIINDALLRLEV